MYTFNQSDAGRKAFAVITCWSLAMGIAGFSALPAGDWDAHKGRLSAVFGPVKTDLAVWLRAQIWTAPNS